MTLETLVDRLRQRFGEAAVEPQLAVGQVTLVLAPENLLSAARALRDEAEFAFAILIDVCGVDYLGYGTGEWETSEVATGVGFSRGVERNQAEQSDAAVPARFAAVYQLLSVAHNQRLRLRVPAAGEPPRVPSVVDIWRSADWFEREAFDMFGIVFEGHPDLRRILTDYGFIGHPFRKDFPLSGHVEMRYDPEKGRVVYEPVSIEPRVLVPRVIRHDNRYLDPEAGGQGGHA